jgi:hypothetical protein
MNPLNDLLVSLYPVKTNFELVRIGGNNDGGYLIPNDLEGITTCFSPGVDVTASFEKDLLGRGIKSHLADASVNAPPDGLEVASFEKMFLGGVADKDHITLEQWTRRSGGYVGDWILQMDIEGSEYDLLDYIFSNNFQVNIRYLIVQFHYRSPTNDEKLQRYFDLLKATHVCKYDYNYVWTKWERL